MDYSELASLMRRCDHRSHGFLTDGRDGGPVGLAIVVNDFDVIGALGNARIDKCLRLVRRRDGRYGHAVFGAVSVRRGDQGARTAQVGLVKVLAVSLVFLCLSGIAMFGEHVQLSGYAKDERVFQGVAERVGVSINQAGQERLPFTVNAVDSGWRFYVRPYSLDPAALYPDLALGNHARAIKDAHIADNKLGVVDGWIRRRRLGKQEQAAEQ